MARRLVADPEAVIALARRNIERMRRTATHEQPWLDIWQGLLELGPAYLVMMLTSKDQFARDLRQSSPFASVLTDGERVAAVRDIKR